MIAADVLVIGAGPAGATLARLLALRGRRVVLVEAGRPLERTELLAPSSLPALAACGLQPLLHDPAIARVCLGIRRRWGGARPQTEDFLRHPAGRGYAVDRAAFDGALRLLAREAGVRAIAGRLAAVSREDGRIVCRIADGGQEHCLIAPVAVDATGRPAALARRLGAGHVRHQRLIAERLAREPGAAPAPSWLDVTDNEAGWSYSLAGPGGWRETWQVSHGAGARGSRRVDASASSRTPVAGDGWIAIGDAACAFDPIASQGLFNAISSALVAAGLLLSDDGLSAATGALYGEAVAATFAHSERLRGEVYAALARRDAS